MPNSQAKQANAGVNSGIVRLDEVMLLAAAKEQRNEQCDILCCCETKEEGRDKRSPLRGHCCPWTKKTNAQSLL